MTNTLVVNGNTYTDGSDATTGMGNGGFRTRLLPMLSDAMVDLGRGLTTTSTTSLTIGTGSQALTMASAIPLAVGAPVVIAATASPTNQMFGTVTARSGTALTVTVASTSGSGTFASWNVQISGSPGPTGVAASTSTPGVAALATQAEADAGTEATKIVTSATMAALTNGATVGLKNALINGDFRLWQRGATFSSPASGSYTADRWLVGYDGTGAFTLALGDFLTSGGPIRYYLNWNQSGTLSGCTSRNLHQRLEGVRQFANQTATLSFTASCTAGTVAITPAYTQYFGSGGSPSANVTGSGTPLTVTTTGTRFSQALTFPSTGGKTLGTTGDFLQITLGLPTTGTYSVSFWDIQLERGSVMTSFERRPSGLEQFLCQRYYQTLAGTFGTYGTAGATSYCPVMYPVPLRTTPTAVVTLSGGGNYTAGAHVVGFNNITIVSTITALGNMAYNFAATLAAEL